MEMIVAKTILEQLGNGRFIVLTGSKNFIGSENGLTFKVGLNDKRVTHVRVTLTPMNVYTVEFLKVRGAKITMLAVEENIYADMLQATFTEHTGMYTTLGTMGRRSA